MKKKVKIWLITFFCIIILGAAVACYFIFIRPATGGSNPFVPTTSSKFSVAQNSIFHKDYSKNYNGKYTFSRINYINLKNLSNNDLNYVYNFYGVADTMGLLGVISEQKKTQNESLKEVLIISDYQFHINHNNKPYFSGTIYGNDDYSVVYDVYDTKICYISLTNLSEETLKNTNSTEVLTYHGGELFITRTFKIKVSEEKEICFDVAYVYTIEK